ncbi:hypothetical protein N9N82_11915 [Luminiphilus sp.]|nr:hypothetical protein [Luminiphilus sp.]
MKKLCQAGAALLGFLLFTQSSAYAGALDDMQRKLIFALVPGAGYGLQGLHNNILGGRAYMLSALRAGGDCNPEFSSELDPLIMEYRDWQRRVMEDINLGVETWTNNDETKGKLKELNKWGFPFIHPSRKEMKQIAECAKSRGYGMDIMSVQGAINWTKDRINEYDRYLPRLWCNEEVYTWMKANDEEANRVFPKLDEAILKSGIQFYYEFSPVTRPMYLEYKNLEAMHQDVYDDEGHVFRSAADTCDRMPRPAQQKKSTTPEEALQTCDTLGFKRGTEDHANCALELITRN